MSQSSAVMVVWVIVALAAVPYVLRMRHPATAPLAAYMIFMLAFTVAGFMLFAIFGEIGYAVGLPSQPNALIVFASVAVIVLPSFLLATWLIRRPPGPPPPQL